MALEESNVLIKNCCLSLEHRCGPSLKKIIFRNCLSHYDWSVDIYPKKRHDRRKTWLDSEIQSSNEMGRRALLYVPVCLRYVFLQTHKLKMCHLKNIALWVQEVWQAEPEVS